MEEHTHKYQIPLPHFKMLAVITDRDNSNKLNDILIDLHVRQLYSCHALGSANSEILDMLGLTSTEKVLTMSLVSEQKASQIMEEVAEKMDLKQHGNGIAFSIPLSGMSKPIAITIETDDELYGLKERCDIPEMETKDEFPKEEACFDLIMAIVNQGYSEELMDVARPAGAKGGTVIHARRVGGEDFVKFFGISVQEEREIVMIITPRAQKKDIMQAINKSHGIKTEAKGMVFSLPVDAISGVS